MTADPADALAPLRERYLGAARKAAEYLQDRLWYITRALEAGRAPERVQVVKAAVELTETVAVLNVIGEAQRILGGGQGDA